MGREALTEYVSGKERAQVRAHLDSLALQLSGAKKLSVALADVRTAVASGDLLKVETTTTKFTLALGAREAAAWAKKILNPPSLADKLGIKPGVTVAIVGERIAEIDDATPDAKHIASLAKAKTVLAGANVVCLALTAEKDIAVAAKMLGEKTALWLVYRKGTKPNGDDIIMQARKAGLKDTKVARISETHAALRFIRAKG
ncbi:MAG: DUF3052 domain-containing protein [Alphaproteobacteria bacterium]|nr:DUF3052 domain-containing protein [Alphaproteobacteria bacterium]